MCRYCGTQHLDSIDGTLVPSVPGLCVAARREGFPLARQRLENEIAVAKTLVRLTTWGRTEWVVTGCCLVSFVALICMAVCLWRHGNAEKFNEYIQTLWYAPLIPMGILLTLAYGPRAARNRLQRLKSEYDALQDGDASGPSASTTMCK
ncbi:MAG: hypothetical protein AMXMBFR84_24870 [Candidatus Hydrogenedentota bacterium]